MAKPDFIIVGAGTAGCVLAGRLTESGQHRVVLIEAGGRPNTAFVSMPAGFPRLFRSARDWAFESEPTADGRRVFIPRGKMLGGSSNMNAQIHQWCHPADFDGWAREGAAGWSWADVAPIFRAQENWTGSNGNAARGHNGPMQVADNHNTHPLSRKFLDAAGACGIEGGIDYNGGPFEGAWLCQLTHCNGKRFSAFDAYLMPAMQRSCLRLLSNTVVSSLIFDGARCRGVRVQRNGATENLEASRGVVLAAGAFGTPHILMHSGVGPARHLAEHGIAVIRDLPGVGQNLQDHPIVALNFSTGRTDTFKTADSPGNLLRYLLFKRGPLASNAIEAFAFMRSHACDAPAPDLELLFAPLEWRGQGLEPPKSHAFMIAPAVVAPRSRGRVLLASADPLAAPKIDFALLSDPDGYDCKVLLEGMRLARRLAATAPLAAEVTAEMPASARCDTDADLIAYARQEIQTVYHPTSTCRMGSDTDAVVDPELAVRGVDGLWIADASVMPAVPHGHPNAVVAMIANRAADKLLAQGA